MVDEERVADLCHRLGSIAEELDDLAMDALRTAIDDGATKRPPEEKRLLSARRAVEKAIRTLQP